MKVALAYFKQASEEDPKYAQAYSGLADTYALLGDWQYAAMTPKEANPQAKAAALKAVELDSALGEAHNSLAFVLDGFDWDLDSGGKEFRRAIELNPGYATAHHWYSWHLALLGRYDEAIAEMKKAESLDPLSLIINADLAELLVLAHSYDESIRQSRKTIEMDPNFAMAHNQLAQAYLQQHMYKEAVVELQKAVQLSGGSPTCIANLARAYALSGRRNEALTLLSDLKTSSTPGFSHASEIAAIYVSLGNMDAAMNWIEKGYAERFNPGVLIRPGTILCVPTHGSKTLCIALAYPDKQPSHQPEIRRANGTFMGDPGFSRTYFMGVARDLAGIDYRNRGASDRLRWLLPSRPSCAESGVAAFEFWYSTSLESRRHTQWKSQVRFRRLVSSQAETASGTDCPGSRRKRLRLHLQPPIGSRARERALRHWRRVVRRCPAQDHSVLGARGRPPIFRSQ